MRRWVPILALTGAVFVSPSAMAVPPASPVAISPEAIPFTGYIVDRAHVFSDRQGRAFTEWLGAYQRRTKHQIAILTLPTIGGQDIAAFGLRLGRHWGVGRRGYDDGILLILATQDRKARVETGRGLQRALPDAFCAEVMARIMIPAFRRGDFARGLESGAKALADRLASVERNQPRLLRRKP